MSTKIGIVSEGVSDFFILKHIIERYLKDKDVYTIPLKPKVSAQNKQVGYGSWQGVFEYIKGNDNLIVEAVKEGCEYVVIQIDTDVSSQYGVDNNHEDVSAFWNAVKEKLTASVHPDFPKDRLIFAICIQEIECWLIPFVSSNRNECENTDRCLNIVNKHIRTEGSIDRDNKNCIQAQRLYISIWSKKRKPKEIGECSQFNYGFAKFVEQMDELPKHPIVV
jgi:hypothetical protein